MSEGSLSKEAKLEQVILHRHLKALLHRTGIDEVQPPDEDRWLALLVLLNDRFRQFEEERHRLQRSLDVHSREVQSLYKELTLERDKTNSALACLDQAVIFMDAQGRPLLMSAEAERLLGWSESELEGKELLTLLGLSKKMPEGGLTRLLQNLRPLRDVLQINARPQPIVREVELQPLIRDRQLVGCLLLFVEPRPIMDESVEMEPAEEVGEVTVEDVAPAEAQAPVEPQVQETQAKASETPLRILLVEASNEEAIQAEGLLTGLQHEFERVSDAEEALNLYHERPFDAVLCCENPTSYSAIELCKKLRRDSRGSYPYFILMTPAGARLQATKALEAGVDAFLNKPLEANELAVRLKVARGVQSRLNRVYTNLMPAPNS